MDIQNGIREKLYEVTKDKVEEGIFYKKREDPSKTFLVVGRSYSGKTHFLVENLNKLAGKKQCCKMPHILRPVYDLILFMTESTDADPLDDIVDNIRNGTARKQILTLRNSHISTCILSQYVKLISPAMRNSIHEWYVTGLKPEEYEYILSGFLSSFAREIVGNVRSMSQLAYDFRNFIGSDILFYSQKEDRMGLIKREEWKKS